MYDEIESEFQNFLLDITNGVFTKNKYLDTWDYEDDYFHKTLNEAQGMLYIKIFNWLKENKPNKYVLFSNEGICVVSIWYARTYLSHYEKNIVK